MKVQLLIVGKTQDKHLSALIDDYVERLSHYLSFSPVTINELKNTKSMTHEQQKKEEGKLILSYVDSSTFLILLDEKGKEYRSMEFARQMEKLTNIARPLCFVIGGPFGFSDEVYERADQLLSLSKMTFSHQMVRLIFVEQLYRAMTILRGEQYHHE